MSDQQGDDKSFTWGRNEKGDLVLDGTIVEKNPHGVLYGPASEGLPAPDPDEVSRLRAERDALAAAYERVEPLAHVVDTPVMRQIVNEYVERGELEPQRTPLPTPEDIVAYKKRCAEPEYHSVLDAMREYALTRPEYERADLETNHAAWVRLYDRLKSQGAGDVPPPKQYRIPESGYRTPEELRAAIESKRRNPGFVEPPGAAMPQEYEDDSRRSKEKEYYKARERHRRAYETGSPVSRAQAEIDLVEKYFAIGEKKKVRRNELDGY